MTAALPDRLPLTAIEAYEALRTEVLQGEAPPEGLGAVVHHGMLRGLALLLASAPPPPSAAPIAGAALPATPPDRQFVRLLANMLLQIQSETVHVY